MVCKRYRTESRLPHPSQLVGLAVLGVGGWLTYVADDAEKAETITGDTYLAGGILLIILGATAVVICGVGILGAIFLARPLLISVSPTQ